MRSLPVLASVLMLAMAACSRGTTGANSGEKVDSGADPALTNALASQLLVDPALDGLSNARSVTVGTGTPGGGTPSLAVPAGGDPAFVATPPGGALVPAPAARAMAGSCEACTVDISTPPTTLGARASNATSGKCDGRLDYGMDWATKMPAPFRLYPRASLREAAGATTPSCNVRIINFQTRAPMQSVLDYYHTTAKQAGYDADHRIMGVEHYLGGTRASDDSAYVVIARRRADHRVDVDIIANSVGASPAAPATPGPIPPSAD